MEGQEGAFKARKGTLSLDFSSRKPLLEPAASAETNGEATLAQSQYAQGFLDALRSVQQINNFEFDAAKKVLSPGFIAPLVTTELFSPIMSPSNREFQAILSAMCAKTPILPNLPMLPQNSAGLTTGFPSSLSSSIPGTSSGSAAPVIPSTSAPVEQPQKVEVKLEPRCTSEESTDNTSERSRSSSSAPTASAMKMEYNELSMDEQERRKLERKRARNRMAATKCRQKKMDKIQELEGMVSQEKQRAASLDMELERLHSTLLQLQTLVNAHSQRGCPTHPHT